jgi:hypothetical protein
MSLAVVAAAAALLSYQSLMRLGELAGYGGLSFLYPVVVDAGAAASCAAWLHTRGRQPLAMTWCLLAISVILNGTVHWLESTGGRPSWWLVVAVAAVPPTVLGLCVHLAVGMGGPGPAVPNSRGLVHDEGNDHEVGGPTRGGEVEPGRNLDRAADTTDTQQLDELLAQGAGRRRVAAQLGISEHQARQMLAAARNGHGGAS